MCVCVFLTENTVVTSAVVEVQQSAKLETRLKLDFKFDSLTLVLYSPAEVGTGVGVGVGAGTGVGGGRLWVRGRPWVVCYQLRWVIMLK